jgi:hypothetical protein
MTFSSCFVATARSSFWHTPDAFGIAAISAAVGGTREVLPTASAWHSSPVPCSVGGGFDAGRWRGRAGAEGPT